MHLSDLRNLQSLHHAYFVEGEESCVDDILIHLKSLGVPTIGNPDIHIEKHDSFSIADARSLTELSLQRPFLGGNHFFIVSLSKFSKESQHALLKTIEEPSGDVVFFFIVQSIASLLPTVRSRIHALEIQPRDKKSLATDALTFLEASFAGRVALFESAIKNKDSRSVLAFLSELEKRLSVMRANIAFADGLRALWRARRLLIDTNASLKQVVEHVALLVPRTRS